MSQASPHDTPPPADARAMVVTGGDGLAPEATAMIDDAAFVIAADSGLDRLWELQRLPHLVVGDLDSVSPEALAVARHAGVPVDHHPTDKDATDTELAVATAVRLGYRTITVVSGGGDRLDHLLGWLSVLSAPSLADVVSLDAWCGTTHVQMLHGPRTHRWSDDEPGATVSLLPWGGDCQGVTTEGLRWPLSQAPLSVWSSRGVSNEIIASPTVVSLTAGVLAVVRPHRRLIPPTTITPTPVGGLHDQ